MVSTFIRIFTFLYSFIDRHCIFFPITYYINFVLVRSRERIPSTPAKTLHLSQYSAGTYTPNHPAYLPDYDKHMEHNYSPENEYAYIADLPPAPPNATGGNINHPDLYHDHSLARSVNDSSGYGSTRQSNQGPCNHNNTGLSRPAPDPPKYFELDPQRAQEGPACPPVKPARTFVVQANHLLPVGSSTSMHMDHRLDNGGGHVNM